MARLRCIYVTDATGIVSGRATFEGQNAHVGKDMVPAGVSLYVLADTEDFPSLGTERNTTLGTKATLPLEPK